LGHHFFFDFAFGELAPSALAVDGSAFFAPPLPAVYLVSLLAYGVFAGVLLAAGF
jgi:hypothetical protein